MKQIREIRAFMFEEMNEVDKFLETVDINKWQVEIKLISVIAGNGKWCDRIMIILREVYE